MLVSPHMVCAMADSAGMDESAIVALLRSLPRSNVSGQPYFDATAVSRAIKRATA